MGNSKHYGLNFARCWGLGSPVLAITAWKALDLVLHGRPIPVPGAYAALTVVVSWVVGWLVATWTKRRGVEFVRSTETLLGALVMFAIVTTVVFTPIAFLVEFFLRREGDDGFWIVVIRVLWDALSAGLLATSVGVSHLLASRTAE